MAVLRRPHREGALIQDKGRSVDFHSGHLLTLGNRFHLERKFTFVRGYFSPPAQGHQFVGRSVLGSSSYHEIVILSRCRGTQCVFLREKENR